MSIDLKKKFSYTHTMKKIFGERLKSERLKNGELQSDLAKILNVDISMVSLWENGKNYPEVKKLIEISEHYQISTDYLLGLINTPNDKIYNDFKYNQGTINNKF